MKFRNVLCMLAAIAMLATASLAFAGAGDSAGFYLGIKGGYHWIDAGGGLSDTDAEANATNGDYDDEDGWTVGAAVGYDFSGLGVDLRMEVEYLAYSDFDYDADNGTAGDNDSMSADIDIDTLMLNLYYDFDTGTGWTPYIGLGAGIAFIDCDLDFQTASWNNAVVTVDDGDADATNFAWMATLGLAYEFNANWALDLGLRYSYFGDTDSFEDGGVKFEGDDLDAFETLLGLRYTF